MPTIDTETDRRAGASGVALLSEAGVAALETAHERRLAAIAAEALAAIDTAIAAHFAERDRAEAAAHEALLARLAVQKKALAQLEAAAAPVAAPAAALIQTDDAALPTEPAMTDAHTAELPPATAAPVATISGTAPASQPQPDTAEHAAVELSAGLAAVAVERRRLAEIAYLARTAQRRADHAAALAELAAVEARIEALAAAGDAVAARRARKTRRSCGAAPGR
ncbi:MAG: hypothetical protein EA355_00445 [Rhodobacteraceae bacterium]|nr:MAG: hypothetical protein EA355_00445 [Paracoccaceae bacterium]